MTLRPLTSLQVHISYLYHVLAKQQHYIDYQLKPSRKSEVYINIGYNSNETNIRERVTSNKQKFNAANLFQNGKIWIPAAPTSS
jgi:chloramphenicol O-acetyltransferase